MTANRFSVSLPESLREFLEREQAEGRFERLETCVEYLLTTMQRSRPKPLEFQVSGKRCRIRRVSDQQFRELSETAIVLHDLHEITTYQLRTGGARLAETYTACKLIFGERGKLFDDWKGSFSFPLTVEVEGCPFKPMYLLNVVNIRRGVDYRLEQIVAVDDERLKTRYVRYAYEHQNPDFQTSDLTELVFRLIGFFEGFLQGFEETCGRTEPFLLSVPSDLILFGFSPTEKFFNRDLDNRQEYEAVQEALSLDLSRPGFFKNRNR